MRIAIAGSGVAGLASAARLAAAGHEVHVFEANDHLGGKLSQIEAGAYRFDAGPSLFTMPQHLDAVFEAAGRDPRAYYEYQRLDESCRYVFADGARITAHADVARFADEVEAVLGEPAVRVRRYLESAGALYRDTAPIFLERSLHRLSSYFAGDVLWATLRLPTFRLFSTMHDVNARWFADPRVVQLFDRYATYNGSNPYAAPGVLTQIPHLEFNVGTFFPRGGMITIPRSLERLGRDLGVAYHQRTPVRRVIHGGGVVRGLVVETPDGTEQEVPTDIVVVNGDVVPAYQRLLPDLEPPKGLMEQERSSSAVIFYWGMKGRFPELGVHNIFFSEDYAREFAEIFGAGGVPTDPTVYVHISSKVEPGDAPMNGENWFVMVNVGADRGQDWAAAVAALRERVLDLLGKRLGRDLRPLLEAEDVLEPRLIQRRTSSHQGALYGTSSNDRNAAFLRHPNFAQKVGGLYFCGGSVHPGGGIPLCLSSARIVSELVGPARKAS